MVPRHPWDYWHQFWTSPLHHSFPLSARASDVSWPPWLPFLSWLPLLLHVQSLLLAFPFSLPFLFLILLDLSHVIWASRLLHEMTDLLNTSWPSQKISCLLIGELINHSSSTVTFTSLALLSYSWNVQNSRLFLFARSMFFLSFCIWHCFWCSNARLWITEVVLLSRKPTCWKSLCCCTHASQCMCS